MTNAQWAIACLFAVMLVRFGASVARHGQTSTFNGWRRAIDLLVVWWLFSWGGLV